MKESIAKIASYVYGFLMETGQARIEDPWGPVYRWEHTLRVASWAWRLAVEEGANHERCVIAALFHDVSHFVSEDYRQHGVRSAEIARDFLVRENYREDLVEDVAYAVTSHVGEANPRTLEAKILQDADTLDRFGCLRILLLGRTAELSDLGSLQKKIHSSMEYFKKVEKGDFGSMWTKRGQAKLKELMKINNSVFSGVLEELESTEAPDAYLDP